jgi:hypothetical protein
MNANSPSCLDLCGRGPTRAHECGHYELVRYINLTFRKRACVP